MMTLKKLHQIVVANPIAGVEIRMFSGSELRLSIGPHQAKVEIDEEGDPILFINDSFMGFNFEPTKLQEVLRVAILRELLYKPVSPFMAENEDLLKEHGLYAEVLREHLTECRNRLNLLLDGKKS